MARKPTRKKQDQVASSTEALVSALRFVAVAQRDIGTLNQTHVRLANNWAVAFNDVLAAGHKIQEDLNACPHTLRFIDALTKCGDSMAITQLDSGRLSIKSGAFKALVPCADGQTLVAAYPDPPVGVFDDRVRVALAAVSDLATEGAQHVVTASVLLGPGTATATDRSLIMQYWHGIDLPPNVVLPKASVVAVLKTSKALAKFGFSGNSFTFYFEDESWIKTQLYSEPWPDVARILDVTTNAWPVPADLFTGLKAVEGFSEDGNVYLGNNMIKSHPVDVIGATYEVPGVPNDITLKAKHLKMLDGVATSIDIVGTNGITYFFGDNIRGALTQVRK